VHLITIGEIPLTSAAERKIDALYELPPSEFTAARNELAKELRRGGAREGADGVKQLKKPTRAAFSLNLLARADRACLRSVLRAGDRLRSAQEAALGGGSSTKLREAAAKERQAVAEAVVRAAKLTPDDLGDRDLERMRQTLHAAAGDDEVRAEVEAGRVTTDHEPVGLGPVMGTPGARKGRAQGGGGQKETAATRTTDAAAAKKLREARSEHERADRSLEAAEAALQAGRDAAEQAQKGLEQAQKRHDQARAAAQRAAAARERAEQKA